MNKTILYIECAAGISGDMLLGAFLDLGMPVEVLEEAWTAIGIDNYEVEVFETTKCGLRALRCRVKTEEAKGPRTWNAFHKMLSTSSLKSTLKKDALHLCKRLFEVESHQHEKALEKLHLHEMGGTDLLLDVVGAVAAVDYFKPAKIYGSPINTGKGFITFSHGTFPVPAPATSQLLHGVPIFQNEIEGELTTPTGALLATHFIHSFGDLPAMKVEKIGIGAGEKEIPGHPNVVRIFSGTPLASTEEDVYLVETNIDDSNPQVLAHFMEMAFEQGALDVFFTPIIMKKNRPAIRLSFLTERAKLEKLNRLLFSETTAIGLRYWKVERQKLDRQWKKVRIGKAEVRIKESYLDGVLNNYQPEYEDCKAVAEKQHRPLKDVIAEAIHQYLQTRQK
jgi:pyridinium-3,5-bisthiocarboxylic acid mononucleotide nickel chelatase